MATPRSTRSGATGGSPFSQHGGFLALALRVVASDVAVGAREPVVGGCATATLERGDGYVDLAPQVGAKVVVVLATNRRGNYSVRLI